MQKYLSTFLACSFLGVAAHAIAFTDFERGKFHEVTCVPSNNLTQDGGGQRSLFVSYDQTSFRRPEVLTVNECDSIRKKWQGVLDDAKPTDRLRLTGTDLVNITAQFSKNSGGVVKGHSAAPAMPVKAIPPAAPAQR